MKKLNRLYVTFLVFLAADLALIAWTLIWFIDNKHF
jgi:hypothetical protein